MSFPKRFALGRLMTHMRLRERMILIFLIFGFLPMLVVSILLQNMVIGQLIREAEQTNISGLNRTVERLNERLDTYRHLAGSLAQDAQLINALEQGYPVVGEAIDLYHYVSRLRSGILRADPDVRAVTVYSANEGLVSAPPYLMRLEHLTKIDVYDAMMQAPFTPAFTGVRFLRRTGDYWTDGAEGNLPVFALNLLIVPSNRISRPIGMVTLCVDEGALDELLSFGTDYADTFIVDEDKRIISASERGLAGKNAQELLPASFFMGASPDELLYEDDQQGRMQLLSRELSCGWRVVTLLSMDKVLSSAREAQRMGIMAILAAALCGVVLVSILSARTATRVRTLLGKFAVSDGAQVDPGVLIEGSDEIAQLDTGFREMAHSLNEAVGNLYEVEKQKREALLITLQSRINPHFLYNTLSSIGWMTRTHTPEQVRSVLELLATYYRSSLSGGRDVITLKEELDGLDAYLRIQKMRASGRLSATITVDPMLYELQLPKMTLQPIVENCIEHGFDDTHSTVNILIHSGVDAKGALIYVDDDGAGIGDERLVQIREGSLRSKTGGYGIQNVQMRLKLHFGDEYGLEIEPFKDAREGTRVTLRIPLPDEGDE